MIEQFLKDAAASNPEMSVVLLRYFNPIGAHEPGMICEKPNGIPNNLMPYITQVAAGIWDHLSVFGNDCPTSDGTGVRDYIHVVDLAKGHVDAFHYSLQNVGAEVFNLGTGVGYSVLDVVHAFEEANGVKIPYEIAPRRGGDLASYYAGTEKVLGWKVEKSYWTCFGILGTGSKANWQNNISGRMYYTDGYWDKFIEYSAGKGATVTVE